MTGSAAKKFRDYLLNSVKTLRHDKEGSTAIMIAVLTPVMVASLAYGSEFGGWELSKRKLQNAADTSAYAAGTQLRSGLSNSDLEAAANLIAGESGFDSVRGTLTLASPPVSGAYSGDNSAVHITIRQQLDRRFSALFTQSDVYATVEATALVNSGRPACVLSLHPTTSGAIDIGGNATVNLTGCDVAANSISATAIDSGTGAAAEITADCVSTVGGVDDRNITVTDCPAPIENASVTADPYRFRPEPDCGGSYQNANNFLRAGNPSTPGSGVAGSINCYSNVGNVVRDINLDPNEVYVLHNSNLRLSGGDTITGTGVTIYLSGNSSITMNGNSNIDISAPLTGDYAGIAIYGARDDAIDLDLTGNNGAAIVGAIYAPNAGSDIEFTGNSSSFTAGECTQVIGGGQVTFWGSAEFDTDCSNSGTTDIMTAQSIGIVE